MSFTYLRTAWSPDRRRARKKLKKLSAAEIVAVSIAKSGRTWLNAMVSHYYHLTCGTPADLLLNGGNLKALDGKIPNVFYTHGVEIHGRDLNSLNRVPALLAGKKVIFLYRDPRDVAVSRYFQMIHRKEAIGRKDLPKGIDKDRPLDMAFMFHESAGLPRIVRFMNAWTELLQGLEPVLRVEYERMAQHPRIVLSEVIGFVDGRVDAEAIDKSVAFASFDNLQALEKNGFFRGDRFGGNSSDSNSLKVRRGKVGGWREYFSSDDAERIDRFVAENLSLDFPYAQSARQSVAVVS